MLRSPAKIAFAMIAASVSFGFSIHSAHGEGIIARPAISRPAVTSPIINSPGVARPSITNHAQNMRDFRNAMSAADGSPEKQARIRGRFRKGQADKALVGGVKNTSRRLRLKQDMDAIAAEK